MMTSSHAFGFESTTITHLAQLPRQLHLFGHENSNVCMLGWHTDNINYNLLLMIVIP